MVSATIIGTVPAPPSSRPASSDSSCGHCGSASATDAPRPGRWEARWSGVGRRRGRRGGSWRPLRLDQPSPHPFGVAHPGLDLTQPWGVHANARAQRVDRRREAVIAGQRVTLRAQNPHRQKVPVVAAQPRQQARAQKRRLARARRPQNREQLRITRTAQFTDHRQRPCDLRVPPEIDRRVGLPQRLPPPIRRPVRLLRRWPAETVRRDPGPAQTVTQPQQTLGQKLHRLLPPSTGIAVLGPSPNSSQRCHSPVMSPRCQVPAGPGRSACPYLRRCGTRSCTRARSPSAPTAHRSPLHTGHWPGAAPPSTASPPRSRCHGPGREKSHRPTRARRFPARPSTQRPGGYPG